MPYVLHRLSPFVSTLNSPESITIVNLEKLESILTSIIEGGLLYLLIIQVHIYGTVWVYGKQTGKPMLDADKKNSAAGIT